METDTRCGMAIQHLCAEIVGLVTTLDSLDGPVNSAEARGASEAELRCAMREQTIMVMRLQHLVQEVTIRPGRTEEEVFGKINVLEALSANPVWFREDLIALRRSSMGDLQTITASLRQKVMAKAPARARGPRKPVGRP